MDIIEDITKEKAISVKEGGSTIESDATENSKSKKRCESSMGKVNPKNVNITVPSSERDGSSMSSMSKHSQDTYSVPRKKTKTIPGPLFKGHEVTQDETDFDKDKKVSSTVEGRTSHPLLDTPPKFDNKRDYKGDTHDETPD